MRNKERVEALDRSFSLLHVLGTSSPTIARESQSESSGSEDEKGQSQRKRNIYNLKSINTKNTESL